MKHLCIHGHFYQPPRENAWLEVVEQQDSAHPFHDWNQRINFECYAPNAAARILDEQNWIELIRNNYKRMSFNFGPTLLSWLEAADPEVYQHIIAADTDSQQRQGHGSAMAQVHGHQILPLCNARDQQTLVVWGIRDFEHRFGRRPEGMWLPETAVDLPSLEVLAAEGILFTVLAPGQAKAIRKIGAENWLPTDADTLETRRPYRVALPSGRRIAVFFYDGRISHEVAFNHLLDNGRNFARRLLSAFDAEPAEPQLVHIATDGETYGHHHRFGEMALADALHFIQENKEVELTNYAAFLQKHPPTWEVLIHEKSSWSCAHGVERWRADCGCATPDHPGWNQKWRGPLRAALDWLRDSLIPIFEHQSRNLLTDCWAARTDYIECGMRSEEYGMEHAGRHSALRTPHSAFLKKHAAKTLTAAEHTHALRLLEMQRHALLMYTSCGWFFDEISGIETTQILQYACRAIQYAQSVSSLDLQPEFIRRLALAPSNVYENGAWYYQHYVVPNSVDLSRVCMHFAVASLFERELGQIELFNYIAESQAFEKHTAGELALVMGRATIRSRVVFSEKSFAFAVLHLGQQNLIGYLSLDMKESAFEAMKTELLAAFREPNLGETIGIMQSRIGGRQFTIAQLFPDEKRKIFSQITSTQLAEAEGLFRHVYLDNYQLMSGLLTSRIPIPEAYRHAASYVLNADLRRCFGQASPDIHELERIAGEFKKWNLPIGDEGQLKLAISEKLLTEMEKVQPTDDSLPQIRLLTAALTTLETIGVKPEIWKTQNQFYFATKNLRKGLTDSASPAWRAAMEELGGLLRVRV